LRRVTALLLALSLLATASVVAATTPRAPRFESCVGSGPGCSRPPYNQLGHVVALAVAPDGRHLYASEFDRDTVTAFAIRPGRRLGFAGCIADAVVARRGCTTAPEGTLEGPAGLAAGNGALFVASERSSTVARLRLRTGAEPTFGSCLGASEGACAKGTQATLGGATALAFGPGGRDLYLASSDAAALTRIKVGGGGLTAKGCLAYAGAFGCKRARKNSLVGADALALAPSGRAAYAVAFSSAAVTELGRSSSGVLTYRGCVGDRGPADCRGLPRGTLTGAAGIAVAPDGRAVYVASQVGTVTRFAVAPSGRLAFTGCIADDGLGGCAPVPGKPLAGATGIVVSPDGRTVYVAAQRADAIVALSTAGATPRLVGCVRAGGGHGCDAAAPGSLRGAYSLAGDATGDRLFSGSVGAGAVSAFSLR
jgi:sugar lactone lactonase YvrE